MLQFFNFFVALKMHQLSKAYKYKTAASFTNSHTFTKVLEIFTYLLHTILCNEIMVFTFEDQAINTMEDI